MVRRMKAKSKVKMSFRFMIFLWLPVILWSLVIFWFSSRTFPVSSEMYWKDFMVKKTAHLIEYAVLSILYFRAFKESGLERKNAAIVAIILCFVYGASDEIHQSFIPGREPRVRDTLIDAFGAGLAMLGIWKLLPTAPKKLKVWAEKLQIN